MTDDVKRLIQNNFITNNIFAERYSPAMQTLLCADYLRVDCGMSSDTFNVSIPLRDAPAAALYETLVEYFNARQYTMALWLWDFLPRWREFLATTPLPQTEVNLGMYADIDACAIGQDLPPGFSVKPVQNAEDVRRFAEIMASVFGKSREADNVRAYYAKLENTAFYNDPYARFFIGYAENVPVSTGSIVANDDTVGIYDIATVAEARDRGYGSAMFHHILAYIKTHCRKLCVLQASPDGAGIYRRAGFKEACEVFVYENAGLLHPQT